MGDVGWVVRWESESPDANQVIYHALIVGLFRFESINKICLTGFCVDSV